MIDIAILATSAWTMIQPYLPVLATKAMDEISKKVPEAVDKVWDAITKKFETKPAAKEALDDVLKSPEDADTQAAFRQQLKKAMTEDGAFATELGKLLESAGDAFKAVLNGDGAIAQGAGAKAVGKGGVMIGGDVSGGNITTGDHNSVDAHEQKKK
jgi:hypothetical protein